MQLILDVLYLIDLFRKIRFHDVNIFLSSCMLRFFELLRTSYNFIQAEGNHAEVVDVVAINFCIEDELVQGLNENQVKNVIAITVRLM